MTATLADHHNSWHRTFGQYTVCPWDCGSGEQVIEYFIREAEIVEANGGRGVKCGACKNTHSGVAAVKFCYEIKRDVETFERNEAEMEKAIAEGGECEHGMSKALCAGPNHWPADNYDD